MSEKRNKVNPMAWVFLAIVLGIASALIWGEKMSFLAPAGNIFINLIKMCCVPLVMCSIMKAVANMNDMRKLGRIGGKMLVWFRPMCFLRCQILNCFSVLYFPYFSVLH